MNYQTVSLKETLFLLQSTFESTADGILIVDEQGKMRSYNQKFRKMWQIPHRVLEDKDDAGVFYHILKQVSDPESLTEKLKFLHNAPRVNCFEEIEFKNGRTFEYHSIPQKRGSKIIGRVFSFRDITDRKRTERDLVYQATHDSLTALPNRHLLLDRMKESIKLARQRHTKVAVALFDINRFKSINDNLGHDAGDLLLKDVAERLKGAIRKTDTLARFGGDEFVLVLPDLQSREEIFPVIQRCLDVFEEAFKINQHTIHTSMSMGISLFPEHGEHAQTLLKFADSAMYCAKADQQKSFQFYLPYIEDEGIEKLAV